VNVLSLMGGLAAMGQPAPQLDGARCVHGSGLAHDCDRCVRTCPVDAIAAGAPPSLEANACVGCAACVTACPTGAITGPDPAASLLTCAARLPADEVELLCARQDGRPTAASDADTGIRVPGCLAALGVGAYVGLAALGLARVTAHTEGCESCPVAELRRDIDAQVHSARRLGVSAATSAAAPAGSDAADTEPAPTPPARRRRRRALSVWEAEQPPVPRRSLFRLTGSDERESLARFLAGHAAPVDAVGRDRWRIVAGLHRLVASGDAATETPLEGLGFATLVVDQACNGCGTCVGACPTGALTRTTDETWQLRFAAADCIACGVCATVCEVDALRLGGPPRVADVLRPDPQVIWEGAPARCTRCGAPLDHEATSDRCPPCDFRRRNPFGSAAPRARSR